MLLRIKGLPFTSDGRISGHRFWRHLEIAIGTIEKAFPTLWQVLEHQTSRWRSTAVERTTAGTSTIFDIKTEKTIKNSVKIVLT